MQEIVDQVLEVRRKQPSPESRRQLIPPSPPLEGSLLLGEGPADPGAPSR